MRCLLCMTENIPAGTEICPNPQCRANLRAMLAGTLAPGTLLRDGTLRIEYPLGRGGFGVTYLATHLLYQQPVAVKEFFVKDVCYRDDRTGHVNVALQDQEEFDTGLRKFLREGQLLARVSLPGVVQVRDLFQERGTAFLVMEYLSGQTLKSYMTATVPQTDGIKRSKTVALSVPDVMRVMNALVASLSALHKQTPPICHLDIKPANIILEPDGRVVLIDFGASRQGVGATRNNISVMAYTPSYAPPELQSMNPEFGPESDVYELGVVLHEMLAGELPPNMENRMMRQGWQPTLVGDPWKSKIISALQLDRDKRPRDVAVWWHGKQAGPSPKIPLAPIFGILSATLLVTLGVMLFQPESKPSDTPSTPLQHNALVPSVPGKDRIGKTTPLVSKVTVCASSGGLATNKCPKTKTLSPSEASGLSLCKEHALYCPECGKVWSAVAEGGAKRVFCTASVHDNMSDTEAKEILRLQKAEPVPQPPIAQAEAPPSVKLP